MPRIERFFAGTKVADWTGGTFGAAAAAADYSTTGYTTERTYTGYQSIAWGTTGTLVLTAAKTVDIWVVAGGGGGGGVGRRHTRAGRRAVRVVVVLVVQKRSLRSRWESARTPSQLVPVVVAVGPPALSGK